MASLFSDKSDIYAASRPHYPQALFQYISSLPGELERAWDCACGNGQAALGLAEHFTHVDASDISAEQIAESFKHPNINYSVQSAEQTSYPSHQFDLVNVSQALHWFEFESFWEEVARLLKPDGVFVSSSYSWPVIDGGAIDQTLLHTLRRSVEPYWAPNNKLVWNQYRDVELPFEPLQTPELQLENHWTLAQFMDYLHSWSATRRCMEAQGQAFFTQAQTALSDHWGGPEERRLVRHPLTIIAGRAWR